MAQGNGYKNTPFDVDMLRGLAGKDSSDVSPEVTQETKHETKKKPSDVKRSDTKARRTKVVVPQKEETPDTRETKEDFELLELFSQSFDSSKSHEESKQEFEESCAKANTSPVARVSLYIKMFDVAAHTKAEIESIMEKSRGSENVDPAFRSIFEKDLNKIPELEQQLAQAEKYKEYALNHPYIKDLVQARVLFHEETKSVVAELIQDKGLERRVYEESLKQVMEKFSDMRSGSYLLAVPGRNDDHLVIRIGGRKYSPSDFTQEDKVLAELWSKLYAYHRFIVDIRASEIMPEFKKRKALFFVIDKDGDAVYLVNSSKDTPENEKEIVPKEFFISPRQFAKILLGEEKLVVPEEVESVAVLLDVVSKRRMNEGKEEDFHEGKMIVLVNPLSDGKSDGKIEITFNGILKHDDDYYLKQDMSAAEKIYAERRGNRLEWNSGVPVYTLTPTSDLSKISHRVIRNSLEYVVAKYNDEKTQMAKETARKQRKEAFYEKLESFSRLEGVENPIPFGEFVRGTVGTWVFDNPRWEDKRVRGGLPVFEGRLVTYESISGRDDREKLGITFLPAPGETMKLDDLLKHPAFKALARNNLLEQKLQKLFREKKFNVQDITRLFPGADTLPPETASFSVFGYESGKKVEYTFVYNHDKKTLRWVTANTSFAFRVFKSILAMEKGRGYDVMALPTPARHFLRRAWANKARKAFADAPIYFQPPGLAEKMMSSEIEESTPQETQETEHSFTAPTATEVPTDAVEMPAVSSRLSKTLSKAGISLEAARQMSDEELLKIEGLGKKALEEIRNL